MLPVYLSIVWSLLSRNCSSACLIALPHRDTTHTTGSIAGDSIP
jgi:hypothetical protein